MSSNPNQNSLFSNSQPKNPPPPSLFSNQSPQLNFSNQLNSDPAMMNQAPQQNIYIPQQMPQQNIFQVPNYTSNSMNMNAFYPPPSQVGSSIKLLSNKEEDKDKKVVAVIVTISNGASYDNLFTSVQQQSQEGTKVQVYSCQAGYINDLISAFDGEPKDETATQMMN